MVESNFRESLGTIVSSIDGPSPSTVSFVVNNGKVHKGMFVELEYSEGVMVCLVEDVVKTNRYFERPDSVKAIGDDLEKNFPAADWEFLLGKGKPLGIFVSGSPIQRSTFPPSPGTKVFKATDDNVKKFLGLQEKGLNLGRINFHDVEMKVNMSKILQKHLAILAMSGAGKSYCVSVLLEELLSRAKEDGQMSVIVFDTHGEYTSFGEPAKSPHVDFSSRTKIIDATKIKIACSKLTTGLLAQVLPELSAPQKRELSSIIGKLTSEMKSGVGPFDLNDVKAEIAASASNSKTSETLLGIISELEELHLFSKIDSPSVEDLAKQGQLTVIDLNNVIGEKKKQIMVAYFSSRLFNARRHKQIPPFALFIEEAHNFIPETTSKDIAIAKPTLRTIAREGRKFGAALVVISQRPKRLDTTTLANCNTNIILRITNPYDLDHIKQSSEGLDVGSINMISSLRVGEALIVGEAVGAPTFFKVRLRTSQPSRHEVTLEEAAKRFATDVNQKNEEADSFL